MTLDLTTVNMGVFYNREMGRAKIYLYTKSEVSSFTRFKFMEGSQNLKNGPIGVFFNRKMGYTYTKV